MVSRYQLTYLTYQGETHSIPEWSRLRNIPLEVIRSRKRQGWPLAEVLGYVAHQRTYTRRKSRQQTLLTTLAEPQDNTRTVCQYCSTHQHAWVVPVEGEPYWHPLPWTRLEYALKWAKAGQCTQLITIIETPCHHCLAVPRERSA